MTVPVRDVPAPSAAPARQLDDVLRSVNRIRIEHGVDPLYELPIARTRPGGPAGVQVWSEPWNGDGGTRGSSVHLGSVDWTYNTPTRFYITVYRCMVTQEGRNRGLEAADVLKRVLDLVGLPIDGVRANLHEPPVTDPFRATSEALGGPGGSRSRRR